MLTATFGRPIEGDRSDGIAVKPALGFLGEPGPKWLSFLPHSHGANVLRSQIRCEANLTAGGALPGFVRCRWLGL
jgi:hypothetical protein